MNLPMLLNQLDPAALPDPAEPRLVQLGMDRWEEAVAELDPATAARARTLAAEPRGRRLLETLFGNSPFLARTALAEPGFLLRVLGQGVDATFAEVARALNSPEGAGEDRAGVMRRLRILKRRAALVAAIADIAGMWPLERVTGALSELAERALSAALCHLLRQGEAGGQIRLAQPDSPETGSGVIVLGMGKLGARELNYSSDIDLIVLFDASRAQYVGRQSVQQFMVRLAQDLVRLMDERTADGYVFRTDLRLRPDPASTPPALSVEAALVYYESTGQNWERAALIKARPVAGDLEAGSAFLKELVPFIWRKHLDFAAIQDIHSIKRQINAHRGGSEIAVEGHNVKLGRGGIREVEFFAQTQQLIWGGRVPELRCAGTIEALRALAGAGRITDRVAAEMGESYRFLRRVEHRLQMVEDQQTHTLPADPAGIAAIATFLGYANRDAFAADLCAHLGRVEKNYAELFEEAPSLSSPGNLVFTGAEDDPETMATLRRLGFADPSRVADAVRGWHHGRHRSTRSQRAREILTELVPGLLEAFGKSAHPDAALARFDQFLGRIPAGVQLFALLQANPGLLALVAEIMAAAPRLAELLARHPILLDAVLSEGFFDPLPACNVLRERASRALRRARDFQDLLDIARRWVNDHKFQVGVQLLRGSIDAEGAGFAFTDIAEAAIDALLPEVEAEFARSHGRVPGGEIVVLALGKLGGREMTFTSDLDLILVYDAPADVEGSDGKRPLAVSTYYARLCQRLINALTALTPEGRLYEVDMRLRPSGNAGPAASSFEAFAKYHDELAWTWEHMALTRARPVAGPAPLRERVMGIVRRVLAASREPARLLIDVAEMRERMAAAKKPSLWDVKHLRGGLVDIEFIAQYLQLREAAARPQVLHQNTEAALSAVSDAGALASDTARELRRALVLWRSVQGMLKLLCEEESFAPATASDVLKATLARSAGAVDFAALEEEMQARAARVKELYAELIDRPAQAARPR